MEIRTGTTLDNGSTLDVTVTTADAVVQYGEAFLEKPLMEQAQILMNTGDIMVVDYLRATGNISEEYFRQRVRDIKTRYNKEQS